MSKQKKSGDIIDFALACVDGEIGPYQAYEVYSQTKKKVAEIGADIIDYIQVCLKKRGVDLDQDYIHAIFVIGGLDLASSKEK